MIEQTVLHYHVTAKIGEGGIGEVWRSHDGRYLANSAGLAAVHTTSSPGPEGALRLALSRSRPVRHKNRIRRVA